MNYWIAAPYKAGKSTLMRNIILNSAQAGHAVAAYCAEGSREKFTLDCVAMLATGILLDQGCDRKHCRLSKIFIQRFWGKRQQVMRPDEIRAIEQARDIWVTLPIRLYDAKDNITDLTTLQYLIKRDKLKYGTSVVWGDYSQLFGTGNLFEQQRAIALKVQSIAANEDIAFCMLTQKNEEGVKSSKDDYSPNIKGGGDAPAAADFMLIPSIDQDQPDIITIQLKLSRHTGKGSYSHVINASSGLFLDKWFKTNTVTLNQTPPPNGSVVVAGRLP